MEESWDADNFEPKILTSLSSSKWEGEDEEEDVKESWEDEEEEKKDEEKKDAPPPAKPKKKLIDKIAEKERAAKEEALRRAAEAAEATPLTAEERLAEKLRRQKLQEESDLRLAMETFGITENNVGKLDSFNPSTKEEFVEFAELLAKKINTYRNKEEFPSFVEDLFRNITVQMSSLDIKRIKTTVDNIFIEKQKVEKSDKAKKGAKGKGKAKLRVEGDNAHLNQYDSYGNYEQDYDDFM